MIGHLNLDLNGCLLAQSVDVTVVNICLIEARVYQYEIQIFVVKIVKAFHGRSI